MYERDSAPSIGIYTSSHVRPARFLASRGGYTRISDIISDLGSSDLEAISVVRQGTDRLQALTPGNVQACGFDPPPLVDAQPEVAHRLHRPLPDRGRGIRCCAHPTAFDG